MELWDFLILSRCERREQSEWLTLTANARQRQSLESLAAAAAAAVAPDTLHQLTCIRAPGLVPYGLFSYRSSRLRFQRLFHTLYAARSVCVCRTEFKKSLIAAVSCRSWCKSGEPASLVLLGVSADADKLLGFSDGAEQRRGRERKGESVCEGGWGGRGAVSLCELQSAAKPF